MRIVRGLIVALLIGGQAALYWHSQADESVNYDETEYIYSGVLALRKFDFSVNPHPPLVKNLAGLAVLSLDPQIVPPTHFDKVVQTDWKHAKQFLYRNPAKVDAHDMLRAARRPMLALWMVLALVVFLWSARLYGYGGGLFSLCLLLTCPITAVSGRLVSTDIGLTALATLALFITSRACHAPTVRRFAIAGIAMGLALGTRHQALVVLGVASGLLLLYGKLGRDDSPDPLAPQLTSARHAVRRGALLAGVAVAVLLALYAVVHIRHYWDGFWFFKESLGPHKAIPFILGGEISDGGWYRYFPVLLTYKLPPLHLAALLVMLGSLVARRPWRSELLLLLPAVLLFVLAVVSLINYGVRHVLPVLPLCYVLAGRLVAAAGKRRLAWLLLAAVPLHGAIELAGVYPHYLGYISPLRGGPEVGYKLLADGNLDGGQTLGHLKLYTKENQRDVYLAYYGTGDPTYYGIRYRYLAGYFDEERLHHEPPGTTAFPRYIAISTTFLQLYNRGAFHWLRDQAEPVDKVGYSMLIYDRHGRPEWLAHMALVYVEVSFSNRRWEFADQGALRKRGIGCLEQLRREAADPETILDGVLPWLEGRCRALDRAGPVMAFNIAACLKSARYLDHAQQTLERLLEGLYGAPSAQVARSAAEEIERLKKEPR